MEIIALNGSEGGAKTGVFLNLHRMLTYTDKCARKHGSFWREVILYHAWGERRFHGTERDGARVLAI